MKINSGQRNLVKVLVRGIEQTSPKESSKISSVLDRKIVITRAYVESVYEYVPVVAVSGLTSVVERYIN